MRSAPPGAARSAALEAAAATSGRAVLISGMTVIVAMAGMFISGDKAFISFAEGAIVVVAIAMFASLTVLPAMLSWLGDRVEKGRVPLIGRRRRPAGQSRFWTAVTGRVMRRPGLSIVLAGGLLVALAIPALQMKSVTSDIDQLPQDLPVIQTYNKVKEVFPTEGVTATVVVEADDVRSGAAGAGIADLQTQVDGSDAFLPGTEVIYSDDGTVAKVDVPTRGSGTDAAAMDALDQLRDDVVPATVGAVEGVDGQRQRRRGGVGRLRQPAQQPAAADLRVRVRAGVPADARHVPVDRDPDQGDPAQPAVRGRRLRRARAGLPERPRRVAARLHRERRRGELAPAVPVRGPVRPLDGLPRVHPLARSGSCTTAA